jgi:site-specific DNA recombinase
MEPKMSNQRRAAAKRTEGKRYALYVRVSTLGQIEGVRFDSLESQEETLREFVSRHGGEVTKVYSDTESGTKLDERPGLVALLNDTHSGLFDEAVAYHFDRWHRNIEIFAILRKVTRETGVRFVSATQDFSDDAEGRLIETQLAGFNAYFSDVVSQKVKLKRRLMAGHGAWCGGRVPFGYKTVEGMLIVIPEEATTVRHIFELYPEHPSATAVRNRLRALGIRDRTNRPWSTPSIASILRNPIYAGLVRHPDGEPVPGRQEAIVTKEAWQNVQAIPLPASA